jgi:hypothetical protein
MPAVGYVAAPIGDYLVAVDQGLPGQTTDSADLGYYLWRGKAEATELTFVGQLEKKP